MLLITGKCLQSQLDKVFHDQTGYVKSKKIQNCTLTADVTAFVLKHRHTEIIMETSGDDEPSGELSNWPFTWIFYGFKFELIWLKSNIRGRGVLNSSFQFKVFPSLPKGEKFI